MNRITLSTLVFCVSSTALGQTAPSTDRPLSQVSPSRLAVGAGISFKDEFYAGADGGVSAFPSIVYEGDSFFFRGTKLGWKLFDNESFELAAIGSLRLDGIDADDFGEMELARNGIDAALLEDRDHGFDVGLSAKWAGSAGELEWELLTDATSASEGHIVSADYGYPMQWGKAQVTPHFGATWLSRASAEYYYGTLDEERARGVLDYKPDAALVPHVGISAIRPLGQSWTMFGSMEYTRLPGELSDSPLVEADTSGYGTMRFGILRRF